MFQSQHVIYNFNAFNQVRGKENNKEKIMQQVEKSKKDSPVIFIGISH